MSLEGLPNVSIVTLLRGEQEFIPLIKDNFDKFDYPKDKLELVIIDDGKESLVSEFLDDERILYLHLSDKEIQKYSETEIDHMLSESWNDGYGQGRTEGIKFICDEVNEYTSECK